MLSMLTAIASTYSAMPGSSSRVTNSTAINILFLIIGVIASCFFLYYGLKTLQMQRSKGRQIQWYKLSSIILPFGLLVILLAYFLRMVVNLFASHPLIDLLLIVPFLVGAGLLIYGIYLAWSSMRGIS